MTKPDDSKPEFYVLGTGTWRDHLPRLPRPVLAIGAKKIYRTLLHGDGFSLAFGDSTSTGLFTARFVAAASAQEAENLSKNLVRTEWKRLGYEQAGGAINLTVDEIDALEQRIRFRSRTGFTFYASKEGENE